MKRIFDVETLEELKEQIAIHHKLSETIADMNSSESRYSDNHSELFTIIRRTAQESQKQNGEYIYEILKDLYSDWSGLTDLHEKYGVYPIADAARHELRAMEDAIHEEDESDGTVDFFDTGEEYIGIYLPIKFMRELMKVAPYFEIKNDDELGII